METPFFRLIEGRSPKEIAEEMKYTFGPLKGRMDLTISGGLFFDNEVIPAAVVEAMERIYLDLGRMRIVEIENTSPNRLYISKPNPLIIIADEAKDGLESLP